MDINIFQTVAKEGRRGLRAHLAFGRDARRASRVRTTDIPVARGTRIQADTRVRPAIGQRMGEKGKVGRRE